MEFFQDTLDLTMQLKQCLIVEIGIIVHYNVFLLSTVPLYSSIY